MEKKIKKTPIYQAKASRAYYEKNKEKIKIKMSPYFKNLSHLAVKKDVFEKFKAISDKLKKTNTDTLLFLIENLEEKCLEKKD